MKWIFDAEPDLVHPMAERIAVTRCSGANTVSAAVLSNRQTLVVFQVFHENAERLVGELGKSHLTAEDLSGQHAFHAYGCRGVGDKSERPFSLTVAPSQVGDLEMAERIRKYAEGDTRPIDA